VLADVMQLVDEQLESSQREMDDVRAILVDAVNRLLRDSSTREGRASGYGCATPDKFTALQFQDISDQLLAHAQTRLRVLRTEMSQARHALNVAMHCEAHFEYRLNSIATSACANLAAFAKRAGRPVGAIDLAPGSAELF
jgi:hypothetical protein